MSRATCRICRQRCLHELQGSGEHLIVGTTWDNRLCAFAKNGRHRWDVALGAFAFDVACADLDANGVDEILTAGADGVLGCFSTEGQVHWQHACPAPLQQVTVARLDGQSPVVLAGGMTREILVLSPKGQAEYGKGQANKDSRRPPKGQVPRESFGCSTSPRPDRRSLLSTAW